MYSVLFLQLALTGLLFNKLGASAIQQQPNVNTPTSSSAVKLEARGTVFEAQSQCYDPLLKSDRDGDGKLSRDEYSFFIEQYAHKTESGSHSDDSLSEYHGLIISNFNGTIDANSQVFDATFLSLRQFCTNLNICGEEEASGDGGTRSGSLPILKEDIESGALDTTSGQIKKIYLHSLCEDTIENINTMYSSFGRKEIFDISLEYEFHTYVIDKVDVEKRLSIEWEKFLHETDVGHFVGYVSTSVKVIGEYFPGFTVACKCNLLLAPGT